MNKSYAVSNISGYADHLPCHQIRLPLKYTKHEPPSSLNEQFLSSIANSGSILDFNGGLIDYCSYSVLNDFRTITLTPILLLQPSVDVKFQRLQIVLPHSIKSSGQITVQVLNNPEPSLLIDLIDENYLFISFKIELSDFIILSRSSARLSLDNFKAWGHISVPYSFELRSSPHFIRGSDENNIFVSLKDGGFLHFKRPGALEAFDVYNFNESSSMLPFFSGFRSKSKDVVLDGISSNSIVDLIPISNTLIATLSVAKVIKVWDITTHNQALAPIELNNSNSNWLASVPTKYFRVVENDTKKYLTAHFTATADSAEESGFFVRFWEIAEHKSQVQLILLDYLTFKPEFPDDSSDSTTSKWLIQDFETQLFSEFINLHVLWKSNTSSAIVKYSINFNTGSIISIDWSQTNNDSINEFSPQHDVEYYANKVLNYGNYNELIVRTAANIFREHAKLDPITNYTSIRHFLNETIRAATFSDDKNSWYRLVLLCEEFKKLGQETLSLTLTKKSYILALQANTIGIFRPAHYYETFIDKKQLTSEGKVANLLKGLTKKLSNKTYSKLFQTIKQGQKLDAKKANDLYNSYLLNKISDEEIKDITHELEAIPDAIHVINSLIDPLQHDDETFPKPNNISKLTKLNVVATFMTIKAHHETLLLNLLILFLICEANDQILLLINKIVEKISNYSIIDEVFSISFVSSSANSKAESSNLSNLENSVFWSSLVSDKLIELVADAKLNEAYDEFHSSIIASNYNDYIVNVISQLINHGEGFIIVDKFFNKLNNSRPIDEFLIGLVYLITDEPTKFFEIFENYDVFVNVNNLTIKSKLIGSLSLNANIKEFLDSIFIEDTNEALVKINYFHSLSQLSKAQSEYSHRRHSHSQKFITPKLTTTTRTVNSDTEIEFIERAISFEKIAIETINAFSEGSHRLQEFYSNIFEMSLNLSKYDLIYDCLKNLKSQVPSNTYKELFSRFIGSLIASKKISLIFPPNENELYKENYLLIDSILLQHANSELVLSNSLKCYEYSYAWRLFGASQGLSSKDVGDKRGAIESLYLFITRFKLEHKDLVTFNKSNDVKQYNLKILEVYIIIINALKSFQNDEDRWLISHTNSGRAITKLEEIVAEYYDWLKLLELELSN